MYSLTRFVSEAQKEAGFDCKQTECLQNLIKKAIEFYNLASYELVEITEAGTTRILYLHSIAEENLLTKIIEIAKTIETSTTVEAVYHGHVIRNY